MDKFLVGYQIIMNCGKITNHKSRADIVNSKLEPHSTGKFGSIKLKLKSNTDTDNKLENYVFRS